MADKRIDQLTAATSLVDSDLLVVEQSSAAKKATGTVVSNYINSKFGLSGMASDISTLQTTVAGKQNALTFPILVSQGGTGVGTVLEAQKGFEVITNANVEELWVPGAINSSTGANSLSTSRIRTANYIGIGIKEIIVADGYKYMLFAYDQNENYLGTWNGTSLEKSGNWRTDATIIADVPGYYYRIVLANTNDSDITTSVSINIVLPSKTDTTLSIPGMAADAATAGDEFAQLRSEYTVSRVYGTFTANSMTFEKVSDFDVKIYGTNNSSSVRSYSFLNEEHVNLYTSTVAPKTFPAGRYRIEFTFSGHAVSGVNILYVKETTASSSNLANGQIVDSNAPFTIAIRCPGNINFGTAADAAYLNIKLYALPIKSAPTILQPTGDTSDRTNDIRATLLTYGHCSLEAGEYYVENLQMPSYSTLEGSGKCTILRLPTSSTGSAVKLDRGCTVRDLKIIGTESEGYEPALSQDSTIGASHGISANGISGTNYEDRIRLIIESVEIERFNGAGIYLYNTGGNISDSASISDCTVHNCEVGIYTKLSEYHRVSNSSFNACYYGAYDDGGNNVFATCGFNGCAIGCYIENLDNTAGNNTHGTFSACTFNHEHNICVKIIGVLIDDKNNIQSGEVFVGCHFAYGSIEVDYATGIHFADCNFLSNTPITVGGDGFSLFSNCIFINSSNTPVTKTGDGVLLFRECYVRAGTAFNPV